MRPIIDRLSPVRRDSGFRQDGYFVWGGSLIRVGDIYHLFASRWPRATGFPAGYREHSEIVWATSTTPQGPYTFREVVLPGRGGEWWDGKMCHNPKVVKAGSTYVLYYIGSRIGSPLRKVGYAWSSSIAGPWQRRDEPLPLGEDANNPAPCIHPDGSLLLAYRDLNLHMHIARADAFDADYRIVAEDIFPDGRLEDPDLAFIDDQYYLTVEDNAGILTGHVRHGAQLISDDGLTWRKNKPVRVYTHTIQFEDGASLTVDRRERPELVDARREIKGLSEPTHLVTGVWDGDQAWCLVQPIAPSRVP
jgi:hypothetical protein